ncbi:hypothetical protein [Pseudaquabacterium pictum]|uniref:Uncharacterized protein n=1 Tax=Pseudaquabacterium pictum TaxID=2315236 RepID=A0A480AV37_9BURK|nr:hypothetical protein [Rubrivivax pictus]GCL64756.1 hypothetical protein AQPW35_38370 [Rubrivivax pictus]
MNEPLDSRFTICFGDDPDEIVTIVEQPRSVEHPLALAAAQRSGLCAGQESSSATACRPAGSGSNVKHTRETRNCNRLQQL